jgi:hypothetical protein
MIEETNGVRRDMCYFVIRMWEYGTQELASYAGRNSNERLG